jgi:hypothetical protein
MKYGASEIMMSDKKGIDYNCGENNLFREGMEFDTVAKTDVLTEDMPKKQTKPTVMADIDRLAADYSLYNESGK